MNDNVQSKIMYDTEWIILIKIHFHLTQIKFEQLYQINSSYLLNEQYTLHSFIESSN